MYKEEVIQIFNDLNKISIALSMFITDFVKEPIDDYNIKEAIKLWFSKKYKNKCIEQYGHISDWDVSRVTNMNKLFENCIKINTSLINGMLVMLNI